MVFPLVAETAYTMAEIQNFGSQLMSTWPDGPEPEDANKHELYMFGNRISNATWSRPWLTLEDSRALDNIFADANFSLERNAITDDAQTSVIAISRGIKTGLRDRIKAYASAKDEPDFYERFPFDLFHEMFTEGALDWLIRSQRANYELRQCVWCGRWFEPVIVRRGRFCGFMCRKRFNNARVSADVGLRTFKCAVCDDLRPLEEFSGLCTWYGEEQCMATNFEPNAGYENYLCIRHVFQTAPRWKRYVEPFVTESLKETM